MGVAACVVASVVVVSNKHRGPAHPDQWDARILPLAAFVEQHRHLRFSHPVYVDFLSTAEYDKKATTEEGALSEADKQKLTQGEAVLRALALAAPGVDLLASVNELSSSGTLAFYTPDTQRVTVKGTDLSLDVKVTLIHELTHAVQDQSFDISSKRTSEFTTSGQEASFRAVVEGDAVRIENEYVDQLSAADRAQYQATYQRQSDQARKALAEVPAALRASQEFPYAMGQRFLALVADQDGESSIDEVFRHPPDTEEDLLDPRAWFRHDTVPKVAAPSLPEGAEKTDDSDFGAFSLLVLLADRIDVPAALRAADGWGGDAEIAYRDKGNGCTAVAFAGDTGNDTEAIRTALEQWAATIPGGFASVTDSDGLPVLRACDAGEATKSNERANDVLALAVLRFELAQSFLDGLSVDKSFAAASCVVEQIPLDKDLAVLSAAKDTDLPPGILATLRAAGARCAG